MFQQAHQDTAISILCDATTRAAGEIAKYRGIEIDNIDRLVCILREVIKENLDEIMDEWREATQVTIGEAWIRQLVNGQANELGLKVIARYTENQEIG